MTYCQQFTVADSQYKVSTNSLLISNKLQHLFAGFESHKPSKPNPRSFEIRQDTDGTINITSHNQPPKNYASIDESISRLELKMIRDAFDQMDFIGIHSGAIVCNGKTILFPGRSGKGKTSLTLGCMLRGSSFLSDEMALIQPETKKIHPFPRVLCVKNNVHIFQPTDSECRLQHPHITLTFNNSLCISPKSFDCISPDHPKVIDAVIFPNFQQEHKTELLPISPIQSLQKLLTLTHKRPQNPLILDTLGHIVESVPSFELPMNNLQEAIERVENFAN